MSNVEKTIQFPHHVWDALQSMSSDMGVAPESLISQAVFTLARLNGYVVPSGSGTQHHGNALPDIARAHGGPTGRGVDAPVIKSQGRHAEPPEDDAADAYNDDDGLPDDLPPSGQMSADDLEPKPSAPKSPEPTRRGSFVVTLHMNGRDPYKMTTDTIVIGRGKHCDFVIDSNRVSREHARIHKEATDVVLEDLGSSNGTFVAATKEKVARRKVKDGEEYIFGTERVRISIRHK